jgi:flagellar motor component MotA
VNRADFEEAYKAIVERAIAFAEKARREGLLVIEPLLDDRKYKQRDILEFGLRLVIDGIDDRIIDKILTNCIALETEEDQKTLQKIQKEAVLGIQSGLNPRELMVLMNSYVDIGIEDAIRKYGEL